MRWRIGKFAGTELWLHGATLLCWAYLLLQGQGMLLAVGLVSIALHEGAHGLAATMLHHPPRQAEITPLGLLLRLKEEARLPPLHRAAVLFAGPAASAALVLLGWYGTRWGMLSPALGARMFFGNLMLLALNNQSISVDEETIAIAGLPSALENYRILHISDLHAAEFGAEQSTLLRTVNNLDYDIMLITGDMVGASGNAEPFLNFLRGLSTCRNVYFIAGDSDPGPLLSQIREEEGTLDQRVLEDWVLEAIDLGATYLDAPVSLTVGATDSATLWLSPFSQLGVSAKDAVDMYEDQLETERIGYLSGIGADYIQYPFTDYRYRQAQDLLSAISQMGADDVHISLSHVPPMDSLLSIVQDDHSATPNEYLYAPDLVLAGHYCGGVVRVPGYGALYVPDALQGSYHGWFPDQSRVRGQITVGNTVMYVTGGLGATDAVKFPFRLFNTPEAALITFSSHTGA